MAEYIDREEAIHAALSIIESSLSFLRDAAPAAMKQDIGSIPTADVQPVKWIPVTERLPNSDTEYVLCCGSKGGMFVGWAAIKSYDGSGKCTGFQNSGKGRSFTHWMPLPKPPEGCET